MSGYDGGIHTALAHIESKLYEIEADNRGRFRVLVAVLLIGYGAMFLCFIGLYAFLAHGFHAS